MPEADNSNLNFVNTGTYWCRIEENRLLRVNFETRIDRNANQSQQNTTKLKLYNSYTV